MKIKVTESNRARIQKEIENARGDKAKERLVSADYVFSVAEFMQAKLKILPKRLQTSIEYEFSMNQRKPSSYQYKYNADTFTLKVFPSGIFLVHVSRESFYPNQEDISGFDLRLLPAESMEEIKAILLKKHFG